MRDIVKNSVVKGIDVKGGCTKDWTIEQATGDLIDCDGI